jgi:hypothetical protein
MPLRLETSNIFNRIQFPGPQAVSFKFPNSLFGEHLKAAANLPG